MAGNHNKTYMKHDPELKLKEIFECLFSLVFVEKDLRLLSGRTGVILALCYMDRLSRCRNMNTIGWLCNIWEEMVGQETVECNYGEGLCGFLSVLYHLARYGYISMSDIELADGLDESLFNICLDGIRKGNNDFFYGSGGMFFMFLEKYRLEKDNKTREKLEKILVSLYAEGQHDHNVFFCENPLPDLIDLGIPHGYSSWLLLLAETARLGICSELCLKMMDNIFLYYKPFIDSKHSGDSFFPMFTLKGAEKAVHSRLGWCYGDVSCLYALLVYSEVKKDYILQTRLLDMFTEVAHRKEMERYSVFDAGICHGTAGLSYIFSMLYHRYGMKAFGDAADFWMQQTLGFSRYESGYAGYLKCYRQGGKYVYSNEYGFLEGIAGIGMSMLSYCDPALSAWGELILVS